MTLLENGDKIFAEFSSATQTVANPDGSQKTEATTVHKWTGGTGKYQGVRGIQRESTVFDPDKNFLETRAEAEYWLRVAARRSGAHLDGSSGSRPAYRHLPVAGPLYDLQQPERAQMSGVSPIPVVPRGGAEGQNLAKGCRPSHWS